MGEARKEILAWAQFSVCALTGISEVSLVQKDEGGTNTIFTHLAENEYCPK